MADSYAVSIHWALTQFTPATNNVAPVTVAERPFFFSLFFELERWVDNKGTSCKQKVNSPTHS